MNDDALTRRLEEDLQAFVARATPQKEGVLEDPGTPFWYIPKDLPDALFNRDIIPPGRSDKFPDGTLGIRTDEDFWAVAALPIGFTALPLPRIVAILWPHLAAVAEYGPDSQA
jgi:hypothetical protein